MTAAKKTLTKSQIVTELAEKCYLNKKQVNEFFDTLTDLAYKETKKNGSFTVPGFGKLVKDKRKARKGRNPQTGEEINMELVSLKNNRFKETGVLPIKVVSEKRRLRYHQK